MGDSPYFNELIVSYLSKELNTEEEAFVVEWINSSEQNKRYFEELKSTWNLLSVRETAKVINTDAEWHKLKQVIQARRKGYANTAPGIVESNAAANVTAMRNKRVYKLFAYLAIAASILAVIGVPFKAGFYTTGEKPVAANAVKGVRVSIPFVRSRFNTSGKAEQLTLPDGSEVKLYENSKVSYPEPFSGSRRDVTLTGKATFSVSKDVDRPFTVYSGEISTTALGTRFTVTAFENRQHISIRLYEGKVVIRPAGSALRKLEHDMYLLPGHELVYDNKSSTAKIRMFDAAGTMVKNKSKLRYDPVNQPADTASGKKTWYMFNNQPLGQVFEQLGNMFNVEIVYPKEAFSKSYFIGTFKLSDSLDDILQRIAVLNNLKVTKKYNKVIISRY